MAVIRNDGQTSFKGDLEAVFETLQEQRTAILTEVRQLQLAARVLVTAEARRLGQNAAAEDQRPQKYASAAGVIANRVRALDIESQISLQRVAPEPRVEAAEAETPDKKG